jgi:DNA polymerase-3 subunit alpha (Gram-positive type)
MVVPSGNDIHNFTPIQRPANDTKSQIKTTHFDYHSIEGKLLKLDLLGHDDPTVIRMLHDLTGKNPQNVLLNDEETMSLFTSSEALGVSLEEIDCETGTLGIPEFGTKFVRQMLKDTKPKSFTELIRIAGLSHGTDVWLNNAKDYVKSGVATLRDIISTRDDIMVYLIIMGVDKHKAFKIMEEVRKGRGVSDADADELKQHNVPKWYIESLNKIKYMFPKAHAAAYVMMAFRIAYFKVNYPVAFYTSYFSVRADDFDYLTMARGCEAVGALIKELNEKGLDINDKEKKKLTIAEVAYEMCKRGICFEPVNIYKSDAMKFIITECGTGTPGVTGTSGGIGASRILPPLRSFPGLGEEAAMSVVRARAEGEFLSIEDLISRTSLSKTTVQLMEEANILSELPKTTQLSLC